MVDDSADFNGDGFSDIAVSSKGAVIDGHQEAGAVAVLYGSPSGAHKQNAVVLTEASPGIPGTPGYRHEWGQIQGHGDFDGDRIDDLLISGRTLTQKRQYMVLWGSKAGLSGGTIASAGEPSATVSRFESGKVSVADVNGDGIADIAGKGYRGIKEQGTSGLRTMVGPLSRSTGKPATTKFLLTDNLGLSYPAVGDVTGAGLADVVTQVIDSHRKITNIVYKGTSTGAFVKGNSLSAEWGKPGLWRNGAFGDINADGYQDFVGGTAADTVNDHIGRLNIAYGGPKGFSTTIPAETYLQATPGVPGTTERNDHWGEAVAMGDTDGDGYADIVIGAPFENAGDGTEWAGAVTVLRGSAKGLTITGAKLITQNTTGVPSASEVHDWFGTAVSAVDTDNDGRSEVYVGGPGEDLYSGQVWKLPTGASGVTGLGATAFKLTELANLTGPIGYADFGATLTN
ncbi:FG-GAP repeat protein [Streptomyces sp. NPDC059956]|uniref:FG-GAP repeat protein n=1 Tax=Streptomyces sp. NPDC059956 TaxID=3347015 RepID=UPI00364C8D86